MNKQSSDHPLLMNSPIKAGFPNPAEEAGGFALDLNDYLVKHPVSTYYLRVEGDSMTGRGLRPVTSLWSTNLLKPDRAISWWLPWMVILR